MLNVLLIIHLIVALCLIGVVLLQRSEGGGLGMGGGGGGMVSQRSAATALSKLTWGLAAVFIGMSIALTVISGGGTGPTSVVIPADGGAADGSDLLPPPGNLGGGLPADLDGLLPPPDAGSTTPAPASE